MIYERELHFKDKDFLNDQYFPKILVVRKKLDDSSYDNQNDDIGY